MRNEHSPDAIDALRNDPAVQNADPAARALLLALLTRGERAEGMTGEKPSPARQQLNGRPANRSRPIFLR